MKTLLLVASMLCTVIVNAQIGFELADEDITSNFRSGVAIVSTDINGDTYDDLVRFNHGSLLTVHLQGQDGHFAETFSFELGVGDEQWNAIAGDLNNDGWVDIVASGAYDKVKTFRALPFTSDFVETILSGDNFFAQGSNIVDINNDSYADIFVCNDNATSVVYLNDSTGAFNLAPDLIDFNTVPASDNSGNYGSIWNDFDSDGDLDLFIAKCRQGVFDPTDPRRINALFVNTDTGYVEMADSFGIASGSQSWSPDMADIDNDGDLDLFITNHDTPSQLFENINNERFEDITNTAGIITGGLAIQSVFHDFNNDGLVDLLIGGTASALYQNVGNGSFVSVSDPFGGRDITSFALGDVNGDGFTDVYAAYHELFNSPSDAFDDAIWLNQGNDNNFLRVKLNGTTCNASAIGARVEIHGAWGLQIREVRAGESYGITNSLTQAFGLGQSTSVDSIVVRWPNGMREVFSNPPVNTTVTITEGGCLMPVVHLDQGPFVQCGADTFALSAPDGYIGYLWSNGATSREIRVSEPGVYHVTLTDVDGCSAIGALIEIRPDDQVGDNEITVSGDTELCFGESVLLTAPDGLEYLWSSGDTTPLLAAQESGEFVVTVTRTCGQIISQPVTITFNDPNMFEVEGDTLYESGSGNLMATGDSLLWYDMPAAMIPVGFGNLFVTPLVDTTTTFFVEQTTRIPGRQERVGMKEHVGGTMYNGDNFDGKMLFDVYESVRVDSFLVMTDFPGERRIIIEDQSGFAVFDQTYSIDSGRHFLALDVVLDPGVDYLIRTHVPTNNASFGTNSPQLIRSDGGVIYPYEIENVISIKSTSSSLDFYYYFFDWHISTSDHYCYSDRKAVEVVVTDTTSTQVFDLELLGVSIYPNPASSILNVELDQGLVGEHAEYAIRSLSGTLLEKGQIRQLAHALDIAGLASGVYLIEINIAGSRGMGRFVKVE